MNLHSSPGWIRLAFACFATLLAAVSSFAQSSPAPLAEASALVRYDRNGNGKLDPEELAAKRADESKALKAVVTNANGGSDGAADEAVRMSPFEVVSDNTGYYAANTMSGTRLNSKLDDLASDITVVTKQQMTDFGMLNINDIFAHEAGVEGSGTYTLDQIDRNGSPYDLLSQDPNNANRMRGLSSANISLSNFETSGRVPVDPINIDAVEISRGPNSSIFGVGAAGGSVNMVASTANVLRNRAQVGLRADSFDGYRMSLDVNRVLLKNKLAIRGNGVIQRDGFPRKPSGTDTHRYNGMVRYQPFKGTSITAGYGYYHLYGTRANTVVPTDGITNWRNRGAATWDPLTGQIKVNGVVVSTAPTTTNNATFGISTGPRSNLAAQPSFYIGPKGLFMTVSRLPAITQNNPSLAPTGNPKVMETIPPARTENARGPLYARDPVVSDKSIYDWSEINIGAVNYADEKTEQYNVTLEQTFLNTPRHVLAAQLSWFREDSERFGHNPLGTGADGGAFGYLSVDITERLLDGSPNPYFLHPFMATLDARDGFQPWKRDTYRGQLAYRLNLAEEKNILRWIGMHQVAVYREVKETKSRNYQYRTGMVDDHAWLARGTARGSSGGVKQPYYKYYLGDGTGFNIDHAPVKFEQGVPYSFRWQDGTTGAWTTEPVVLGLAASTDTSSSQRLSILKTTGATVQSHLWNGRIVTTVGQREDSVLERRGSASTASDGINLDSTTMDAGSGFGPYVVNEGKTKTYGYVVRPLRNMSFLNRMNDSGSIGHFLAGALGSIGYSYNKSDNFSPTGLRINLLQERQPNPTGKGKDVGISVSLFDNKLHIRAIKSHVTALFSSGRNNSGGVATRLRNIEYSPGIVSGVLITQARAWMNWENEQKGLPALTDAEFRTAFAKLTQQPETWNDLWTQYGVTETDDSASDTSTLEINYNPKPFWTMKFNVTEQKTFTTRVSDGGFRYLAERLPIWQKIVDPRDGQLWYTNTAYGTQTPANYVRDFILSPYNLAIGLVGVSDPQIRKYRANFSTNLRLSGITEHRILKRFNVGGSVRWEDKGAIGFGSVEKPPLQAQTLDRNAPLFDKAHYYVDLLVGYRTRIFKDKVGLTLQLNARNLQEDADGSLRPIRVFPDGTPNTYRIIDPRQFILSATFDL